MNYHTLAPPFTKANAAEYARRATISRERNRARRKQELLGSPDLHARKEIEKQIQKVLRWMEKAEDKKEYGRLCVVLDRLWNKAYAEVRPSKRPMSRPSVAVELIHDCEPGDKQPQWQAELAAPEPTMALASPSKTAPVIPGPTPAAPESPPPSPVLEALPQSGPQQPMPGSVSPPTSVSVPPMVVELKAALSAMFRRPADQAWMGEETRLLLAVAHRRSAATELQLIVNFRRRLTPEKKSSFPPTASALLENWDKILAYARQHLPR
jgi:hypothetical protein